MAIKNAPTRSGKKLTLNKSGGKKESPNKYQKEKNKGSNLNIGSKILLTFKWCLSISLGLLLFLGVSAGLVYAYKFFVNSEYFVIKTIEIDGINRLKSRELLETIGLETGMNSLAVSIDEMKVALNRNPWIKELSIRRSLPDRFVITIVEREPKYWRRVDGVLFYADVQGRVIAPVTASGATSLPELIVEPAADYLTEQLPYLVKVLEGMDFPLNAASLPWLKINAAKTVDLALTESIYLSIGIDEWAQNVRHLTAVLNDLKTRGEFGQVAQVKAFGSNVWVSKRTRR